MEKFLGKMIEILDTEIDLVMETKLDTIEEWDSLSMVSFLAMADIEYKKQLVLSDLKKVQTIRDLFNLINDGN